MELVDAYNKPIPMLTPILVDRVERTTSIVHHVEFENSARGLLGTTDTVTVLALCLGHNHSEACLRIVAVFTGTGWKTEVKDAAIYVERLRRQARVDIPPWQRLLYEEDPKVMFHIARIKRWLDDDDSPAKRGAS